VPPWPRRAEFDARHVVARVMDCYDDVAARRGITFTVDG